MKKVIIGILSFVILASCGKFSRKATIERDCTGTYIELNDRDYFVCNPAMISSYPDGSTINVKFNKVNECPSDTNLVLCEMYHKNYGNVEITEIK
jgi:hypothetical protein